MLSYLARRIALMLVVVIGATLLAFAVMDLAPGDTAELIAFARYGEQLTPREIERVRQTEGLDAPLPARYVRWLGHVVHGDLGTSLTTGESVTSEISHRLPATAQLAAASILIALLIGISAGIISATQRDTAIDSISRLSAILGVAMPNFWLALLLILLFSLTLGWLPSFGKGDIRYLILPALTLGTGMAALLARIMRSSLVEVLAQDYIRTARAKGLSEYAVVFKHALKNALIPPVTIAGLQFGRLLEGAVIVESIFGWPGLGRLLVESIFTRDFAMIQGCVLVTAMLLAVINLLVDISYAWLDPRIIYQRSRP